MESDMIQFCNWSSPSIQVGFTFIELHAEYTKNIWIKNIKKFTLFMRNPFLPNPKNKIVLNLKKTPAIPFRVHDSGKKC